MFVKEQLTWLAQLGSRKAPASAAIGLPEERGFESLATRPTWVLLQMWRVTALVKRVLTMTHAR
jgi:hypothetical protein